MQQIKLNNEIAINLPTLIESRLLIQANSGGGKSWAIRRIIEQAFGKVQIIVLDPEGEFSNLRKQFDFVLAGKDGETPAEPRSAEKLAIRLLELKVSAIIDLYELFPQERKHFVRLFLDSMINSPKDLHHDVLVILDEAHQFCPEHGDSEAASSVIGLTTLGRKRGFCAILATQRISKLHKDAAAECNNKLIGRAGLDIDRKRAAEEIGFTTKEDVRSIRVLAPGEFYMFGPAISNEVIKAKVGELAVLPPRRGTNAAVMPPTPAIRKILGQLADLPKEAEAEARTIADYKKQVAQLRRDLTLAKRTNPSAPAVKVERIEIPAVGKRALQGIQAAESNMRKLAKVLKDGTAFIELSVKKLTVELGKVNSSGKRIYHTNMFPHPNKLTFQSVSSNPVLANSGELTTPERRILNAIAWFESIGINEPEKAAVAFLAGYKFGSGGFNNPCGSLRTRGMIEYQNGSIVMTEAGRSFAQIPENALTTETLHQKVMNILPTPEQRILQPLLETYPEPMTTEELAGRSGYQFGSGGFNNPKGKLRTLGLIEYLPGGRVVARKILFID
ncbi:MAG: DUF87 domain-containing protein [Patescibacteria group bacterium]|nr:DUF87 domain-containing protein [Patescibacteria group bacterium]